MPILTKSRWCDICGMELLPRERDFGLCDFCADNYRSLHARPKTEYDFMRYDGLRDVRDSEDVREAYLDGED